MKAKYLKEIMEQPAALRRCTVQFMAGSGSLAEVAEAVSASRFEQIILTGMGSSLHSCYPLRLRLSRQTNIPTLMWDASELIHQAPQAITGQTLLIVVSQSGESAEILQLLNHDQRPSLAISITNQADNSLARWADIALVTEAGPEEAISTKTYTTTLAVLALLGRRLTGLPVEPLEEKSIQLANQLANYLTGWRPVVDEMAAFLDQPQALAFIGRGASLAAVHTGALITNESSKLFSMGLSAGQFRHGPLELARPGFAAVVFAGSGPASRLNQQLARDIGRYGGRCLVISAQSPEETADGVLAVPLPAALPELLPILEIVPIQLLTIPLAKSQGFQPATFEHASKVTSVE